MKGNRLETDKVFYYLDEINMKFIVIKVVIKSLTGSRKGLETHKTNKNIHIYQKEDRNPE